MNSESSNVLERHDRRGMVNPFQFANADKALCEKILE